MELPRGSSAPGQMLLPPIIVINPWVGGALLLIQNPFHTDAVAPLRHAQAASPTALAFPRASVSRNLPSSFLCPLRPSQVSYISLTPSQSTSPDMSPLCTSTQQRPSAVSSASHPKAVASCSLALSSSIWFHALPHNAFRGISSGSSVRAISRFPGIKFLLNNFTPKLRALPLASALCH